MENAKNGASESLTYSSLEASQMQPEVPDFLTSIKNALEGPNVYNFANLLVHPNVRQLENTAHTNYLHTLQLFAYDTYKEYLANRGNYIVLSDAMENKLKHLTIKRMAIGNTCIPYEDLCARLNVNVDSDLEQLINETIAAGFIQGSPDAVNRVLKIDYILDIRGKRLKSFWERIIGSKVQQRWIELSVHILGMRDKLVGKRKHYAYK